MMDKLIDKEALLKFARNHVGGTVDCNDIARFPTVDAERVKHGEWFELTEKETGEFPKMFRLTCSLCKYTMLRDELWKPPYCPNCGARMDSKVKI